MPLKSKHEASVWTCGKVLVLRFPLSTKASKASLSLQTLTLGGMGDFIGQSLRPPEAGFTAIRLICDIQNERSTTSLTQGFQVRLCPFLRWVRARNRSRLCLPLDHGSPDSCPVASEARNSDDRMRKLARPYAQDICNRTDPGCRTLRVFEHSS